MKVPLLDLSKQYQTIRDEVLGKITEVCDSGRFVLGGYTEALEKEVANISDAKYGVAVSSGTDALLAALMAFDIGPKDKVITTPFTFFATGGSIARTGAKMLFADIDYGTFNINPLEVEKLLKKHKNVKAIVPVHLYGQSCDMGAIMSLAKKYKVKVIEDAAQAIGAKYKGKGVGGLGDAGCFSFYPSKNLGAFGDGGLVTTNSKKVYEKLQMIRLHGMKKRYYHDMVGANFRMDEIQAAVLMVKIKYLADWSRARAERAMNYEKLFELSGLAGKKVILPLIESFNDSVYNQFVIRVKKRDKLKQFLFDKGIGSEVYYPVALHMQKCFKELGYKKGVLKESEKACRESLAIPMYPELPKAHQKFVVDSISEFFDK